MIVCLERGLHQYYRGADSATAELSRTFLNLENHVTLILGPEGYKGDYGVSSIGD